MAANKQTPIPTSKHRTIARLHLLDGIPFNKAMVEAGYAQNTARTKATNVRRHPGYQAACRELLEQVKNDPKYSLHARLEYHTRKAAMLWLLGQTREAIIVDQHIDKLAGLMDKDKNKTGVTTVIFNRDISGKKGLPEGIATDS